MKWNGVIDAHLHMGFRQGKEYSPESTIDRMDRNGIERAIVLHFMAGLFEKEDFKRANDYIQSAFQSFPERFIGMCVVSPIHGKFALDEFERCLEIGFGGLKLHPGRHGPYSLRGQVVEQLLERVESSGAVLFIHSDFNNPYCTPYEVALLGERFPKAKIILGHLGLDSGRCHLVPSIVERTPNIFLDTSQTPDNPETVFVAPVKKLGKKRLLFGSDGHLFSPEVNLKKLEVAMKHYDLSESDAQAIVRDNALSLLSDVPNVKL